MNDFNTIFSTYPSDTVTHGITVMLIHDFEKTRKYTSHKSGVGKGSVETFCRRIYLHIYLNTAYQVESQPIFKTDLLELKTLVEGFIDVR